MNLLSAITILLLFATALPGHADSPAHAHPLVATDDDRATSDPVGFTDQTGVTTHLESVRPPLGKRIEARGKKVRADAGLRRGPWITLSPVDGLQTRFIGQIHRDRWGYMWFRTYYDGVIRYDGQFFVHFSAAEGLAGNDVHEIVEDRVGNLWFGTDGGVSRYNGKSFVTFTTADGLAGNDVHEIVEDRSGSLWFGTKGGVSRGMTP